MFERIALLTQPTTVPVYVTPEAVIGLHSLIMWLNGFRAGSDKGDIPGQHELIMHYRSMIGALEKSKTEDAK